MPALHVILEKGGIEEGFITLWTLQETKKTSVNISPRTFLTKKAQAINLVTLEETGKLKAQFK